ncbi:hypothetical protein ACN47A_26810 [Myxococcus fulvus]|uniref:hypothetical protein n=1 Tax=Myxococcus fulvus TaxID=33 RepID=UPI003B99BA04
MFSRAEIHKGMKVRGNDGHVVGRIVDITEKELIVEKGLLRRHDFAVSFDDVSEVLHGEVVLHHGRDSLFSAPREVEHVQH